MVKTVSLAAHVLARVGQISELRARAEASPRVSGIAPSADLQLRPRQK